MKSALYLPYVASDSQVDAPRDLAHQLFDLMSADPAQGRKPCEWSQALAALAYQRVYMMAMQGWADHVDPHGVGPNQYALNAGFMMPDNFDRAVEANNCESLAFGGGADRTAQDIWSSWMNSASHKEHVLGLDDYFAAQNRVGVGCYFLQGSQWGLYISLISWPF